MWAKYAGSSDTDFSFNIASILKQHSIFHVDQQRNVVRWWTHTSWLPHTPALLTVRVNPNFEHKQTNKQKLLSSMLTATTPCLKESNKPPKIYSTNLWKQVMLLFAGCLTSPQHAGVSQERIYSDKFTCCHTEIEVAHQTFHLTQL